MRVCFLHSDKPREVLLADAFLMGAKAHGHETGAIRLGEDPEPGSWDVVAMVGVKSRERFQAQQRAGARIVYLDKGYSRHKAAGSAHTWEFWRVAIDSHQPTARLADQHSPPDRLARLGWEPAPWRAEGSQIVIAGSSQKYHDFYGLMDPTTWAHKLVKPLLKGGCERPIYYRPKPSWREAVEIEGTIFSRLPQTLPDILAGAHVLITHGSNACFDAVLAGVPSIVLGDGVAKPISSTDMEALEAPRLASDDERAQWLANLSWWQWTAREMADGACWAFLGRQLHVY